MAGANVYSGDVLSGLDFKNNHEIWIAVGRTSAWTDENNPPDEDRNDSDITEIVGFKKADVVSLAKQDGGGAIEFNGQNYTLVSDGNAYTETARFVYIKASLEYDTFPVVTFRQTAIYADLTPASGHESDDPILPADVSDNGILRYYRNHVPRFRDNEIVDIIELVIDIEGQNT